MISKLPAQLVAILIAILIAVLIAILVSVVGLAHKSHKTHICVWVELIRVHLWLLRRSTERRQSIR